MPSEDELHGFVDGALDEMRRGEVAACLRSDPALALRVADYAGQRDALAASLRGLEEQPVPPEWVRLIEAATSGGGVGAASGTGVGTGMFRRAVPTRRYAIAAGVALALTGAGVTAWKWPAGDAILADANAAREERLPGGRILVAGGLPDAAARDALLQRTVGMKLSAPALERFGFQLARLDLFERSGHGAVQLSYVDAARRVLTIYVRRSSGEVRFDLLRQGATRVCVWQDDVVGAVLMAPMGAGEMMRVASSAYRDLNL